MSSTAGDVEQDEGAGGVVPTQTETGATQLAPAESADPSSGPAATRAIGETRWYREASVVISILALLASIGSTVYTGVTTRSDRELQAQSRLSTVLLQLNSKQQELSQASAEGPVSATNPGSAQVRLLAADAARAMQDVDAEPVEKLTVAQALVAVGLPDRALPLLSEVDQEAQDFVEIVTARSLLGTALYQSGRPSEGADQFGRALVAIGAQPLSVRLNARSIVAEIEFAWAKADLGVGNCGGIRMHLGRARRALTSIPGVGPEMIKPIDDAVVVTDRLCPR